MLGMQKAQRHLEARSSGLTQSLMPPQLHHQELPPASGITSAGGKPAAGRSDDPSNLKANQTSSRSNSRDTARSSSWAASAGRSAADCLYQALTCSITSFCSLLKRSSWAARARCSSRSIERRSSLPRLAMTERSAGLYSMNLPYVSVEESIFSANQATGSAVAHTPPGSRYSSGSDILGTPDIPTPTTAAEHRPSHPVFIRSSLLLGPRLHSSGTEFVQVPSGPSTLRGDSAAPRPRSATGG